MDTALAPRRQASRYACSTSSTVASGGTLIVFEMAPEMNGCTAPSIRRWPVWWIDRLPRAGLKAQSNTRRCCGSRSGAPSIVSCASMCDTMASTCGPS